MCQRATLQRAIAVQHEAPAGPESRAGASSSVQSGRSDSNRGRIEREVTRAALARPGAVSLSGCSEPAGVTLPTHAIATALQPTPQGSPTHAEDLRRSCPVPIRLLEDSVQRPPLVVRRRC